VRLPFKNWMGDKMRIEKFDTGTLQEVAQIIGDMFTGGDLRKMLKEANIENVSQNSTKWRILEDCFAFKQNQDDCANNILNFVQIAFTPTRNINNEHYDDYRSDINRILSFSGLEIKPDGKASIVEKSVTINDAKRRATNLKKKLRERNTHKDIFTYCGDEIETENYFHVVFEATKGIFDKIRKKTGLISDGAD
jgi:hypothetical protein